MEKEHGILLLLIIFSSTFVPKPIGVAGANNDDDCFSASCGPNQPGVEFPFRILGQQPAHCGFPGFDLSCDHQNRTIIQLPSSQLPSSRSYIVNIIDNYSQTIYIDPEFCLPNRIADVNIDDTPFSSSTWRRSYTFYNCSLGYTSHGWRFPCLSKGNYSVIASARSMPSNCKAMKKIVVPVGLNTDISYQLELTWKTPNCMSCEMEFKTCRLASDDGQTVCVSPSTSSSIPKSTKYGLGIGIGVPVLNICIVGLICYVSSRSTHTQSIDISSITSSHNRPQERA